MKINWVKVYNKIIIIMEPTMQAREDVICLTFGCPLAPFTVLMVDEGVASQVTAE